MITIKITHEGAYYYFLQHPASANGMYDPEKREGRVTFYTGRGAKAALKEAVERFGEIL